MCIRDLVNLNLIDGLIWSMSQCSLLLQLLEQFSLVLKLPQICCSLQKWPNVPEKTNYLTSFFTRIQSKSKKHTFGNIRQTKIFCFQRTSLEIAIWGLQHRRERRRLVCSGKYKSWSFFSLFLKGRQSETILQSLG